MTDPGAGPLKAGFCLVLPYHKPPIRAQGSLVHGTAITQMQLSQKVVQNYNLVIKLLSAEIYKVEEV